MRWFRAAGGASRSAMSRCDAPSCAHFFPAFLPSASCAPGEHPRAVGSRLLKRDGVRLGKVHEMRHVMSGLPWEVALMLGQTIEKVLPITLALAVVFSVLSHFWACNPGKPWWQKRELVTDMVYWFFVPVFARVLRIGLLVLGAGVVFNIHDADELIAFYENGHGPL